MKNLLINIINQISHNIKLSKLMQKLQIYYMLLILIVSSLDYIIYMLEYFHF